MDVEDKFWNKNLSTKALGLVFAFHNDFPDHEHVNARGMNFYAGYADVEDYNIPESVFKNMFGLAIPTGVAIEWNAAEQTHFVTANIPFIVSDAKAFLRPVLLANGFVEL